MTITQILTSAIADLALGVSCGVAFACLVGAILHFDAWLDARKDDDGSTD